MFERRRVEDSEGLVASRFMALLIVHNKLSVNWVLCEDRRDSFEKEVEESDIGLVGGVLGFFSMWRAGFALKLKLQFKGVNLLIL